ncbi:uncharacterized protein PHACADRAFT_209878 [Phanerochaete carnosa HHB-10118-sp]|uniref:Uncharacterized protein n=1 Tax=Phanerochaete carnosa (strain HHB-10118-sp) TaxID=650164 RepID=K5WUC4_PHACS|nr:uncharacterized protein PHACADRAFT_209878 [Phanerochaete carnosa HHB-10118-sp]EKM54052.1 hypothetical protein PHACADRAFT_209878 [Phanerochaete carnosa HHB-10118-sp]
MYNLQQYFLQVCPQSEILSWIFSLIGYLQIALFSALRVFAIWNRSYVWSLMVFTLSMVPFATNLYAAVEAEYTSIQVLDRLIGVTCIQEPLFSAQTHRIGTLRVTSTTRGLLVLADTIVLVLTWIKTFRHWKNARHLKMRSSVTTCLLRGGTLYFIALLAINIAQLLTYGSSGAPSFLNMFITTLPPVLIGRFMINLRTAGSETGPDYSVSEGQSALQFRKPTIQLGNIGETLQGAWSDESCDEENDLAEVDEGERRETTSAEV